MKKIFIVISIIFSLFLINCKPNALTYNYYPKGSNYIDPYNHDTYNIAYNEYYFETKNPFLVKAGKTYTLFVTYYNDDYIKNYHFYFYDANYNLINTDVVISEQKNKYDGLISAVTLIVPASAKRMGMLIEFGNRNGYSEAFREVLDEFFVFCEGTTYPGPHMTQIKYEGAMKDLEPVIEGSQGLYITNVDDPIDVNYIKNSLYAYDENDGDVTNTIIIYQDNYTENKHRLGLYDVIFRANDSSNNYTYFTVFIQVIDTVAPVITVTTPIIATNDKRLSIQEITSYLQITDNYDDLNNITLELISDNYSNNYNKVGTYNITFKVTDSSFNSIEKVVSVSVIDVIKPTISGPMNHIKSNKLNVSIDEFVSLYEAIDETDGIISNRITILEDNYTFNQYKKGVYEVKLGVKDIAGNEEVIIITIEVIDEIGPVFYIDRTKIVIDLSDNVLSTLDIINYYKKANLILENKIINIIEDTYSENKNIPGVYKLVLGYDDERLEIEIEVLDKLEKIEEKEKVSFWKKIIIFIWKIIKIMINFFKKLFYKG